MGAAAAKSVVPAAAEGGMRSASTYDASKVALVKGRTRR